MLNDYKQRDWEMYISQFERSKELLAKMTTPYLREILIRRLNEIKARYPRYIKEEIPER